MQNLGLTHTFPYPKTFTFRKNTNVVIDCEERVVNKEGGKVKRESFPLYTHSFFLLIRKSMRYNDGRLSWGEGAYQLDQNCSSPLCV